MVLLPVQRSAIAVCLAAYFCCSCLAQAKQQQKIVTSQEMQELVHLQKTKQWQVRAKNFDKHKVTAASIFDGATKVETFRLAANGAEKSLGKVHSLPFYAKGADLEGAFAQRLGKIVLSPQSYPAPGLTTKQCYMDPGVDFRVWNKQQYVDVLLCYKCNELVVFEYAKTVSEGTVDGLLKGRFYVIGDFDYVRPQLIALTREAWPNDPVLSKL